MIKQLWSSVALTANLFQDSCWNDVPYRRKFSPGENFRQFRQCLLLAFLLFPVKKLSHTLATQNVYSSFGGCCTCIYLEFKASISNLACCRYCRTSKLYLLDPAGPLSSSSIAEAIATVNRVQWAKACSIPRVQGPSSLWLSSSVLRPTPQWSRTLWSS